MKKSISSLILSTLLLIGYAQNTNAQVEKTKDFKTGICTITQKPAELANGITYVLTKVIDVKNENKTNYYIKITMANGFQKTLNKDLSCSAEFEDGTFIDNKQTKEHAGWFKGTLTLEIKRPNILAESSLKHLLLKGEKTKLYHIDEKEKITLKNNIIQIIQEQI
jgi:hypothetical protein